MSEQDRLVADRFRLIRRLGSGAMASVFLAEDCELGRRVAIKRLHPDPASAEVGPRFRREMRVAASLSHPNVVTLYDAIEDDGDVLLIMELVDGPTLAQRMSGGPLEPDEALRILRAIASAVDHLHARGIIHRDIKPANILIDGAGEAKLTDLGIASAAEATGITTSGTILGTPAYMAPELFDGERATGAADVYSVAAITFEMLTGRRARGGGTPAVIAMRAATEPPPDLRELWPDAGPLADVLERGMARDPAQRYESATALVDAVEDALDERELPPTEVLAAGDLPPAPAPQGTAEVPVERDGDATRDRAAVAAALAGTASDEPVVADAAPRRRAAAEPRRDGPGPATRARRDRRAPAVLLLGAAALAVAALVAVLLAGGGGGGSDPGSASTPARSTSSSTSTSSKSKSKSKSSSTTKGGSDSSSTPKTTTQSTGQSTTQSTGQSTTQSAGQSTPSTGQSTSSTPSTTQSTTPPTAAAAPTSPEGAVQAFYQRAVAHDYDNAWALAAPSLRSQFGSFGRFQGTFATARRIVFARASTVRRSASAATVAITTTTTHTNRTDHCTGTVDTAPGSGGGWVVTHVAISC